MGKRLFILIMLFALAVPEVAHAASYKLTKSCDLQIYTNETINLNIKTKYKVKWSTSDKEIAKISKKGKLRAIAPGEVVIKAKFDDKVYKCIVTVIDQEMEAIERELAERENLEDLANDTLELD